MKRGIAAAACAAIACWAGATATSAATLLYDTGPGAGPSQDVVFGDATAAGQFQGHRQEWADETPIVGSRMGRVEVFMQVLQPGELEFQLYLSGNGTVFPTPGLLLRDVITDVTSTTSTPQWIGVDMFKNLVNKYWLVVTTPAGSTFEGEMPATVPNPPERVIGYNPLLGGWGYYNNVQAFGLRLSAAPEPRTWVQMLLGFASLGLAMRRRRLTGVQTAL